MSVAGIVLAGGSGSRVQRDVNKVFLPLRDREMLAYSLDTMDRSPMIDRVVLVVRDEDRGVVELLLSELSLSKVVDVVAGGPSRHQSEHNGIEALADRIVQGEIEIVVIHDGARPFMTTDLLHATIEAARTYGGGIPGLTIEAPIYEHTVDAVKRLPNDRLRRVQTPQAFRAAPLLDSYRAAKVADHEGVDTAETVERYSDLAVKVVEGDPRNIKVTFVEDIFQAEDFAASWLRGAWTD
jgi:2-C-methyl-D-erythritol 4-phosphate cytidylyltransferase